MHIILSSATGMLLGNAVFQNLKTSVLVQHTSWHVQSFHVHRLAVPIAVVKKKLVLSAVFGNEEIESGSCIWIHKATLKRASV